MDRNNNWEKKQYEIFCINNNNNNNRYGGVEIFVTKKWIEKML